MRSLKFILFAFGFILFMGAEAQAHSTKNYVFGYFQSQMRGVCQKICVVHRACHDLQTNKHDLLSRRHFKKRHSATFAEYAKANAHRHKVHRHSRLSCSCHAKATRRVQTAKLWMIHRHTRARRDFKQTKRSSLADASNKAPPVPLKTRSYRDQTKFNPGFLKHDFG